MAPTTRTPKPAYRPRVLRTTVYGVYQVQSESNPTVYYTVDGVLGECSCKAAEFHRACKHVRLGVATWTWHYRLRSLARRRASEEAAGAFPVAA